MRSRSAKGISSVVVSIIVVGTSLAGDAVPSGLKPGEFVSPFDVEDVTGPNKGTNSLLPLSLRCCSGGLRVRPQDLRALGQFGQADR